MPEITILLQDMKKLSDTDVQKIIEICAEVLSYPQDEFSVSYDILLGSGSIPLIGINAGRMPEHEPHHTITEAGLVGVDASATETARQIAEQISGAGILVFNQQAFMVDITSHWRDMRWKGAYAQGGSLLV